MFQEALQNPNQIPAIDIREIVINYAVGLYNFYSAVDNQNASEEEKSLAYWQNILTEALFKAIFRHVEGAHHPGNGKVTVQDLSTNMLKAVQQYIADETDEHAAHVDAVIEQSITRIVRD